MYTIGQTLYFSPAGWRYGTSTSEVTITKVGRKWLTFANGWRADTDTLKVDGGDYSSLGKCYLSKYDYEAAVALDAAWKEFQKSVNNQYVIPPSVTLERIEQAKALLFGGDNLLEEKADYYSLTQTLVIKTETQAAEIERLQAEIDRLRVHVSHVDDMLVESVSEVARLQAILDNIESSI